MCGFFGQFNTLNLPKTEFKALLALAKQRGPDDSGYFEGENVQLGFNRLSIIDLSEAGHQPMSSNSNRYTIVFNGEIYNHLEIRKKLPKYNYEGHSDTETITFALECWGIEKTVESLDGMFAIAIYDSIDKNLTLVRDFAGIKPLFFGFKKGQLVFGSQYDQIIAHPLFSNESYNLSVFKLYLKQHFVPAPFGIHANLHQLRPGELVRFDINGDLQKKRYWKLSDEVPSDLIKDKKKAQLLFEDAFQKCVQDQLVADVPLGAFLSGGVDSSLVCAFAKPLKNNLSVFSIGSDSKVHDESERAKQFADSLNVKQHLWKLNANEMLAYWDKATKALHEPLADFSILPTYLVSKLARENVTVALSGDGGDELFFGYERFWSVGKNISYQGFPTLLRKGIYGLDKVLSSNKNVNSLLTLAKQSAGHESLHSRFTDRWLNEVAPDLKEVSLPEEWDVYSYHNCSDSRELMAKMRQAEFYGMMQKTLRKVDLASMENSLEIRVPFLQKSFIEAVLQIDPMLSYGPNKKKEVLKQNQLKRFPNLPDDNVKRGFSVPLGNWIKTGLHDKFEDSLNTLSNKNPLFKQREMSNMLKTHKEGKDLKWPLFTLYALSKF